VEDDVEDATEQKPEKLETAENKSAKTETDTAENKNEKTETDKEQINEMKG